LIGCFKVAGHNWFAKGIMQLEDALSSFAGTLSWMLKEGVGLFLRMGMHWPNLSMCGLGLGGVPMTVGQLCELSSRATICVHIS